MPARHRYLLADPVTDRVYGYVPMGGVSYSRRINVRADMTGTLPVTTRRVGELARLMRNQPVALYIERQVGRRTPEIWWGGLIWTGSLNRKRGQATTCQVNGATFDSYPDHRRIWEDLTFDDQDRGQVIAELWEHMQTRTGNASIGVDVDPVTIGGDSWSGEWAATKDATYGEALAEIGGIEEAFETTVNVYRDPDGTRVRKLRYGTPLLGNQDARHLIASPSTLIEWTGLTDHTARGTHARVRGAAVGKAIGGEIVPLVSPIVVDQAAVDNGRLRVDVGSDYDTEDEAILASNAASLVTNRPSPPSITVRLPDTSSWSPGLLGDTGRFTIHDVAFDGGVLNGSARVIGMQVKPAQRGEPEEVTFEFQPEEGAT